eukprot:361589-Chlamydomonas_euryale.AAC.1
MGSSREGVGSSGGMEDGLEGLHGGGFGSGAWGEGRRSAGFEPGSSMRPTMHPSMKAAMQPSMQPTVHTSMHSSMHASTDACTTAVRVRACISHNCTDLLASWHAPTPLCLQRPLQAPAK